MDTTAGSFALQGAVPPGDAKVVQRLREAGAIIIGERAWPPSSRWLLTFIATSRQDEPLCLVSEEFDNERMLDQAELLTVRFG